MYIDITLEKDLSNFWNNKYILVIILLYFGLNNKIKAGLSLVAKYF